MSGLLCAVDQIRFINSFSANKPASLFSVDRSYYVCYIVLMKVFGLPKDGNRHAGRMLDNPTINRANKHPQF